MISSEELQLIKNEEWIQRKRIVLDKIEKLFYQSAQKLQSTNEYQQFCTGFPELKNLPKVNKGEMLRGLPWRMLDFPVHFSSDHVLANRLLFWWGQPLYNILHLKGAYLQNLDFDKLSNVLLDNPNLKFRTEGEEWDFSFVEENIITKEIIESSAFLQIWKSYPLKTLEQMPVRFIEDFKIWKALLLD
ncbi:MAG: hypothetical protein WD334_07650 [Chitinophagales bacterium]